MRIRHERLHLILRGEGELAPWMGPALRGMLAERFRDRQCVFARPDRPQRCTGCPEMPRCAYGRLYEPDVPQDRTPWNNQQQAARPLTLAPDFPLSDQAHPGMEVAVTATVVGNLDAEMDLLLDTLEQSSGAATLGEDRIGFVVEREPGAGQVLELPPAHLPATPDQLPGLLPTVTVWLTAPLFITAQRQPVLGVPEFGDLLRTAVGTLSHLFHLYGEPLQVDFRALVDAARQVRLVEHCILPFRQRRNSRRSGSFDLEGIQGWTRWADVPLSLLPWLVWGGRLRVGENRVAGAGGWRVVLE